jgi:S1-C subfamily serine protease
MDETTRHARRPGPARAALQAPRRQVADQLARFGRAARGQLGVIIADHPAAMPITVQAQTPPGAMVISVSPGSPAKKAGIQSGDVIIAIDGKSILSAAQLRTRIGLMRVGAPVEIALLRNGNLVKANAVISTVKP